MAKINGVFEITGEAAIEVNGERYELIEGPAKKGDIAKIVDPWASNVKGAFYPVINEDHCRYDPERTDVDDFVYIDGETCHASGYRHRMLVFRKVAEFKKGDKVRLLEGEGKYPLYGFTTGEVYEVRNPKYDHEHGVLVQLEREVGIGYAKPTQLELVEEETPKQVEGTLKTEKRHAKVGERILIVKSYAGVLGQSYEKGDVLQVVRLATDLDEGDVYVEGERHFIDYEEYEVIVEDAKVEVGDIAKITGNWSGKGRTSPHRFEIGEIVEVTRTADASDGPAFRCKSTTSGIYWSVSVDHLEKVEEEPKAEEIIEVGDIVKFDESKFGGPVGYGKVLEGPDGTLRGGNYEIDRGDSIYTVLGDDITLLVKAKDRADKE